MAEGEPMSDEQGLEVISVECVRMPPERISPDKVPEKVRECATAMEWDSEEV